LICFILTFCKFITFLAELNSWEKIKAITQAKANIKQYRITAGFHTYFWLKVIDYLESNMTVKWNGWNWKFITDSIYVFREVFSRLGLVNLQRLYLSNCKIGQIDPTAFRGLTNLVELNLAGNLLTAVPTATFSGNILVQQILWTRLSRL